MAKSKTASKKSSSRKKAEKLAGLDKSTLRNALNKMYLIRFFEERAEELYAIGKLHGTMHLSVGQEASAMGAILALNPDDYILSTHRGHGHCIAKGADPNLMMAEFFGKETGYCRGRGGSMHIADVDGGNLGANGVVGGGLPIAPGVGLSAKMQKNGKVILVFFGDGASNTGAFHESMNLSAVWDLPVVYVCENNQYAMSMPVKKGIAVDRISKRAAAYDMPGVTVDGNDLFAVYQAVKVAVDRARKGKGPSLVENFTYRWKGHSKSDRQLYRTKEEVKGWMEKDPILRLRKVLLAEKTFTEKELDMIKAEAKKAIEESVEFAEAAPEPDPATIMECVYA